jgi:hypothetical protein
LIRLINMMNRVLIGRGGMFSECDTDKKVFKKLSVEAMDPASERDPVHQALVMADAMQALVMATTMQFRREAELDETHKKLDEAHEKNKKLDEAHEKNKRLQAELDKAFEKIKLLEAELEQKQKKKLEEANVEIKEQRAEGEEANVEIKEQRAEGEEANVEIKEQRAEGEEPIKQIKEQDETRVTLRKPRGPIVRVRKTVQTSAPPELQAKTPPPELQAKTPPPSPPPPPPPTKVATAEATEEYTTGKRARSPAEPKIQKAPRSESPPSLPFSSQDLAKAATKLKKAEQPATTQPQTMDPKSMHGVLQAEMKERRRAVAGSDEER